MAVAGRRADTRDARVSAADLYARHAAHLFRFCLGQLRNRAEAEDAVQTTFLQAFRALQRGTIPHVERAWLIAIAQNVCHTMHRSSARRRDAEVDADPEEVAGASDMDHPLREEISELERALARIPANQRRALVLHEWHGLRYREIAGVMGVSQTAVEMLAFRARRSLSQALSSGSARVSQALDLGGILAAIRAFLSTGAAAHALAGVGVAGLALTTIGASATPASVGADRAAKTAVARVTRSSPSGSAPRGGDFATTRARAATRVRHTATPARPSLSHSTSAPLESARRGPPNGSAESAPSNKSAPAGAAQTRSTPAAPPIPPISPPPSPPLSLPATPPLPSSPVTVPQVPQPPALTVPSLPPVSTPAVMLPTP